MVLSDNAVVDDVEASIRWLFGIKLSIFRMPKLLSFELGLQHLISLIQWQT
jgi:hypothetical protein